MEEKELTKREEQVYKYLVETSLTYPQIAKRLKLSTGTLATHKTNIFYKKLANSRLELVIKYHQEKEEALRNMIEEREV